MSQLPVYAPVRSLVLFPTEDCNLRCSYCFVDKKPRVMSSETARKAVDFFLSRNISGAESEISIAFFGGEPFTEMDLMEEVIAYARKTAPAAYKRINFSATTNGTIANERAERIIRDGRLSLLVSMDGDHRASEHRPFVSGGSSYETVARNLPRLASWSSNTVVRMTFHPEALELAANVGAVLELGAPSIALCPVLEADWEPHQDRLEASYQELAVSYIKEARQGRILPLEVTRIMLAQYHDFKTGHGARPARPCQVGASLLAVNTDGQIMPCHRYLYRKQDWLGTVEQPLLDDARMKYVHLSSRDILGCDSCIAEPVCGGGCRAVAANAGLSLNQAFPAHCLTMRAHMRAVIRIHDTLMLEGCPAFIRALRLPTLSGPLAEFATR